MNQQRDKVSNKKYIVFVGNISFDTSKDDIMRLFKECNPISVRFPVDKNSKKAKGFAFVEFKTSRSLEMALELQHKKLNGRKINVELTAGGGGSKSRVRAKRIEEKNLRLREEQRTTDK